MERVGFEILLGPIWSGEEHGDKGNNERAADSLCSIENVAELLIKTA